MRANPATSRSARPLVAATVCLLIAVTSAIVGCSHAGVAIDRHVFAAISVPVGSGLWNNADRFNDELPALVLSAGVIACAVAAGLGMRREAIAVGSCIVISAVLAEGLKRAGVAVPASRVLVERASSWPSVHAAAITALSASAMLAPTRVARCATLGATAIVLALACLSLLVTTAHTPFDLLGGAAVAGVVCSLARWRVRSSVG